MSGPTGAESRKFDASVTGPVFVYPPPPDFDPTAPDNRHRLFATINNAIIETPGGFAVVTCDVDGMRAMNAPPHGHALGDSYLNFVRDLAKSSVRSEPRSESSERTPDDLLIGESVHTSGDEYWFILYGVLSDENLRAAMARIARNFTENGVSATFGGHRHRDGESAIDTYLGADADLNANKDAKLPPLGTRAIGELGTALHTLQRLHISPRDVGKYVRLYAKQLDLPAQVSDNEVLKRFLAAQVRLGKISLDTVALLLGSGADPSAQS